MTITITCPREWARYISNDEACAAAIPAEGQTLEALARNEGISPLTRLTILVRVDPAYLLAIVKYIANEFSGLDIGAEIGAALIYPGRLSSEELACMSKGAAATGAKMTTLSLCCKILSSNGDSNELDNILTDLFRAYSMTGEGKLARLLSHIAPEA